MSGNEIMRNMRRVLIVVGIVLAIVVVWYLVRWQKCPIDLSVDKINKITYKKQGKELELSSVSLNSFLGKLEALRYKRVPNYESNGWRAAWDIEYKDGTVVSIIITGEHEAYINSKRYKIRGMNLYDLDIE
ncbi:MAG: hypothetical protein IJK13_02385 [Lachnospiraceae bacterium]|nr:hypothetical protein [Lachnospiraceae bacterium]